MSICRLNDVLSSFDEHWEPLLIASVNDHDVKVAKIQGEFIWHSHPAATKSLKRGTKRVARHT